MVIHGFVWLFLAALYSPIFVLLYKERWALVDYNHAVFILPAALAIAWVNKIKIRASWNHAGGSVASLVVLFFGLSIFVFGWKNDFVFLSTFSLLPTLCGVVWFLYGRETLRAVWFPLAYLVFLIPPPLGVLDEVTLPLRYWVTHSAEFLLRLIGLPVSTEGLTISLAGKEVYIAPACSGLRSVLSFVPLAAAYLYFLKTTFRHKAFLSLCLLPLAMIGNLLRVLFLCLYTFFLGPPSDLIHDVSGVLTFLIVVTSFMLIEKISSPRQVG